MAVNLLALPDELNQQIVQHKRISDKLFVFIAKKVNKMAALNVLPAER